MAVTVTVNAYICLKGGGGWKISPKIRTYWMDGSKQMLWNIGPAKYTKASPPARKMSLFSSIIIKIILSYAIFRIYTILHIYLQVSETQGLAELHWVIGPSVLEKINSIYFQGISLEFSRMFFQESECAFKNPNVLNIQGGFISNLIIWNLSKSIFYIRISTKKVDIRFFFLCDAKLITSLLIF